MASLCNESRLTMEGSTICRAGEPTEAALRVLVEKLGCPEKTSGEDIMAVNDFWARNVQKRATLEFARDRKSMSVLCNDPDVQPDTGLGFRLNYKSKVFRSC